MRILVHDYGGYPFCLELSREIARCGYEVQHVYFPAACTSVGNVAAKNDDPPTLRILPIGADMSYKKYSLFSRRAGEIAYGKLLAAHIEAWRPNSVLSANAPLDVQRYALAAARAKRIPFVYWLQDLISVAMGQILRQRFGIIGTLIARYYEQVERRALRSSDAVICISEDFLRVLSQWDVPGPQCTVIENWAPKEDIRPQPKDNVWSRKMGLQDRHVFLYAGRLGFKHRPELLYDLAYAYRDEPQVRVVVVAEGPGADWLMERKRKMDLDTLQVMPFQPYRDLPNVLAAGDVLVCVIEPSASIYSVPSKILSYLAASRAILAAIPSDNTNARHITRINAGTVVSTECPADFLSAARKLMNDDAFRTHCAERARRHAEEAFEIGSIAQRFLRIILPDGAHSSSTAKANTSADQS